MPTERYEFTLFLVEGTSRSDRAHENLRRLCLERLGEGGFHIEVVDVLREAGRAEAERVVATPTVIRVQPQPRRRLIGDLSLPDQAAHALDLPTPLRVVRAPDGDGPQA